jgi:hypothetical protein
MSEQWYYCLKHRTVEQGQVCTANDRLGPYPTREGAEQALSTAAERTERWDNDPRWKDD